MAKFTQIPGELDIIATHGDDFLFTLDFDINLTGYTFSSKFVVFATNLETTITVTNTDLPLGQIKLSIPKATMAILPLGKSKWYLNWSTPTETRRVLAGVFEIVKYP